MRVGGGSGSMVNSKLKPYDLLAWPAVGIVIGFLVAMIPAKSGITVQAGIAAWCVAMGIVLVLGAHPIGARIGALVGGAFMAVPCFLAASPLARCLLACCMAAPFLAGAALVRVPPIAGFKARVGYLCTWCGTRPVLRRARSLDVMALRNLVLATLVLAAAIGVVKALPASGLALPVRWFAGGIMFFAVAEMITAGLPLVAAAFGLTVPALFQSPYLSTSLGEFWTKRWNLGASELFRKRCFLPLVRFGPVFAISIAFTLSAIGHTLLALLALGSWWLAMACGAFFLVQPPLIIVERWMNVRRWRPAAARAWTLGTLAITSPLLIEPTLQVIERSWGGPDEVLLVPTAAALGFVIVLSIIVSVASLACRRSSPVLA
jgi:membrane bound O-acyltransferase family protein